MKKRLKLILKYQSIQIHLCVLHTNSDTVSMEESYSMQTYIAIGAKVQLDLKAKRIRIFKREEKSKSKIHPPVHGGANKQEAKDQEFLPKVRKTLLKLKKKLIR